MTDKFPLSDRVKQWVAKRPGPQPRPKGVAPPCVGCQDEKAEEDDRG